jgi:hypothetical protein
VPDDLPPWLDAEADPPELPARRRRWLLPLLAAVPWVLIAVLLLTRGPSGGVADATQATGGEGGTGTTSAEGPPEADVAAPAATPDALPGDASAGSTWAISEHRGAWRIVPGDGTTAAIAVVVARSWLTGVAPMLELPGLPAPAEATYLEHLAVEAIERPAPGAAVVTLVAVLLERGAEDQHEVRVERLAVPIVEVDDVPAPAGAPWWLPPPDLTVRELDRELLDDPDLQLAALEAFEAAGSPPVELLGLERTSSWPVIAHVRTEDPTGAAWEGPVWLRRHLEGFALAGLPLPSPPPHADAAPPLLSPQPDEGLEEPTTEDGP